MSSTITGMKKGRVREDLVWIALFIAFIALPGLGLVTRLAPAPDATENRSLHGLPGLPRSWEDLRALPEQVADYYHDHFGFRNVLLHAHGLLCARVLGVSPQASVVLGREGWLFYNGAAKGDADPIADARRASPLSAEHLKMALDVLRWNRDEARRRGARYLFIIVPNKSTLYGRYLPPAYFPLDRGAPIDQLADALNKDGAIPFLDLREPLRRAAVVRRTHHKTDSHWNMWGSYVGYEAIMNRLAEWAPSVHPHPIEDYEIREEVGVGGWDLSVMMGLRMEYGELNINLYPRFAPRARVWAERCEDAIVQYSEIDDPALPRAVIIHDSFTLGLMPFLPEHFRRAAYGWSRGVDWPLVDREKPELILHIMAERYLRGLPKL